MVAVTFNQGRINDVAVSYLLIGGIVVAVLAIALGVMIHPSIMIIYMTVAALFLLIGLLRHP